MHARLLLLTINLMAGNPKNLRPCCCNKLHFIALFLAVTALIQRD